MRLFVLTFMVILAALGCKSPRSNSVDATVFAKPVPEKKWKAPKPKELGDCNPPVASQVIFSSMTRFGSEKQFAHDQGLIGIKHSGSVQLWPLPEDVLEELEEQERSALSAAALVLNHIVLVSELPARQLSEQDYCEYAWNAGKRLPVALSIRRDNEDGMLAGEEHVLLVSPSPLDEGRVEFHSEAGLIVPSGYRLTVRPLDHDYTASLKTNDGGAEGTHFVSYHIVGYVTQSTKP